MKSTDDRQAFPDTHAPGMTLRQWYAGQALAGLMAGPASADMEPIALSRAAVAVADALLATLEQR